MNTPPSKRLTFQEANERRPRCRECGCLADFVFVSDQTERKRLGELISQGRTMTFMDQLQRTTGCSILESKATYTHLIGRDGLCHRCHSTVPDGDIADCPNCGAVNIRIFESGFAGNQRSAM
jgi:hypothetical protein